MWVLNRTEELVHLANLRRRGPLRARQLEQWHRIVYNLNRPRGQMDMIAANDAEWDDARSAFAALAAGPEAAADLLQGIALRLQRGVALRKMKLAGERKEAWRAWVLVNLRRGGGALHNFTKRTIEAPEMVPVLASGLRDASTQACVDADWAEWKLVWERLASVATSPWRNSAGNETGEKLPRPTALELRRAGRSFRSHTGVGADHFLPHWFAWLSDSLLGVMGGLMSAIEAMGVWPQQLQCVLMHLIPKEAGGRRPIGLVASFIRLWERVRAPLIRQWRIKSMRAYNWAAPGRSAERAAWLHSLADEVAKAKGMESATALIDLVKAFEHIPLSLLWRRGAEHGFPMAVLRLVLEICAAPRRLVFRGALSQTVSSLTAVVAGLVMAVDLMFLAIVNTMDELSVKFPEVGIITYVDDLTLRRAGPAELVKEELRLAVQECVRQLEEDCHMVVSRGRKWRGDEGKSVAVASTKRMRRILTPGFKAMGIRMVRQAKLLGVDFCPEKTKGVRRPAQLKRWGKALARRGRVRRLGERGGARVAATGLAPIARYGASVTGVACRVLRQLATITAEVFGPTGGRSATARLAVRGADTRIDIILRPVQAWLEEVWKGEVDPSDMEVAWKAAQGSTGLSSQPHRSATSSAAAYIAALARIGWKSPAFDAVLTREGHVIRVGEADVKMLMRLAVDDLQHMMAVDSEVARDFMDFTGSRGHHRVLPGAGDPDATPLLETNGPLRCHIAGSSAAESQLARVWRGGRFQVLKGRLIPWFLPAAMVLKGKLKRGGSSADRSTAAMVEGGWWTRARLYSSGLRSDPICHACGKAVGNLWHRMGECAGTADEREGRLGCAAWLLRKGKASLWDPLFSRGVPALPLVPPPPPARTEWGIGGRPADGAYAASGDVYTDGAVSGRWRRIMRAGWGIAALKDDADEVLWALHGTCPDVQPSVVRAELKAVLEALRVAVPPLRLHVDNLEVVIGFQLGEDWCVNPRRDGAELWRAIWGYMRDIGGGVDVLKVKAHTEIEEVEDGIITHRDRKGNMWADAEARKGAALAEGMSPTARARLELLKAIRWTHWARRLAASWTDDVGPDEGRQGDGGHRGDQQAGSKRKGTGGGLRHILWQQGGAIICRRCGREATTVQKVRLMHSSRCLGSAVGRLLVKTCLDPAALSRCCAVSRASLLQRGWVCRSAEDDDGRPDDRGDWYDEGEGDEMDERQDQDGSDGEHETSGTPAASSDRPPGQHLQASGGQADFFPSLAGEPSSSGHGQSSSSSTLLDIAAAAAEAAKGQEAYSDQEGLAEGSGSAKRRKKGNEDAHAAYAIWMDDPAWLYLPHLKRARPTDSSSSSCGGEVPQAGGSARKSGRLEGDAVQPRHSPSPRTTAASSSCRPGDAPTGNVGSYAARGSKRPAAPPDAPSEEASRRRIARPQAEDRPYGRRYLAQEADPVDAFDANGHRLAITGSLIWCLKCGRYAAKRLGKALTARCLEKADGVYASRLERLRQHRHPITNLPIVD